MAQKAEIRLGRRLERPAMAGRSLVLRLRRIRLGRRVINCGNFVMMQWLKDAARFVWELVKIIIISIALILPIRALLIQPFYVQGASMYPNFIQNDYLLIDEITYGVRNPITNKRIFGGRAPQRGEIVVFSCNFSTCGNSKGDYLIKRVVGLPGETVTLKNGTVTITPAQTQSTTALVEPYVAPSQGYFAVGEKSFVLQATEYFVLGDNRDVSFDSEDFGPIPFQSIVGRVWIRGWPFGRMGPFPLPRYTIGTISIVGRI